MRRCATSPQLNGRGGLYCESCEDCDVTRVIGDGEVFNGGVGSWALGGAKVERLWALSERLTGTVLPT